MWELSHPWWEFVLRASIVYVFVLILLRISGKKQIGEMSPVDLVLLLILSETVQNAMNAGDDSVTAGLILSGTLVALSRGTDLLAFKSKKFERLLEGSPSVLVHNGIIHKKNLNAEKITAQELTEELRKQGVLKIEEVRYAILETDGKISVIQRDKEKS